MSYIECSKCGNLVEVLGDVELGCEYCSNKTYEQEME